MGLQPGDVLEAVNGEAINVLRAEEVSARLHAKAGTTINLTIQRALRDSQRWCCGLANYSADDIKSFKRVRIGLQNGRKSTVDEFVDGKSLDVNKTAYCR